MLALRRVIPAGLLAATLLLTAACADDDTSPEPDTAAERSDDDDADASDGEDPDDVDGGEPSEGDDSAEGDEDAGEEGSGDYPLTIEHDGGQLTLDAPAEAIVSLSPTATEMLFAIGAGDQVVAADVYSTYPPEAPTTELSGFDPNVEAVAEIGPDLVVLTDDRNEIVAGLDALGIDTIVHHSAMSLDDVGHQLISLGQATGHQQDAEELAASIEDRVDELVAALPTEAAGLSVYHELTADHYSATSDTFVGQIYGLFGLENIADAAPEAGDAGGYPQLSPEYIIEADPDLIFLAQPEDPGSDVAGRPGWDQLRAVQHGSVVQLDPDVASRWGPRVVEQIETIADTIEQYLEVVDAA